MRQHLCSYKWCHCKTKSIRLSEYMTRKMESELLMTEIFFLRHWHSPTHCLGQSLMNLVLVLGKLMKDTANFRLFSVCLISWVLDRAWGVWVFIAKQQDGNMPVMLKLTLVLLLRRMDEHASIGVYKAAVSILAWHKKVFSYSVVIMGSSSLEVALSDSPASSSWWRLLLILLSLLCPLS